MKILKGIQVFLAISIFILLAVALFIRGYAALISLKGHS